MNKVSWICNLGETHAIWSDAELPEKLESLRLLGFETTVEKLA